MIVKLQIPLNDPSLEILAHDQSRKWKMLLPQTPELRKLFGTKLKIFVEAERLGETLDIKSVVPDRGW